MQGPTAIIGTPGYVSEDGLSTDQKMVLVGQNTGNLVFQYAVRKILKGRQIFAWPSFGGYESVRDAGLAIFPAANHLRIGGVSEDFLEYLESIESPVVLIGLGVQSTLGEPPEDILKLLVTDPLQVRFLTWLRGLGGPIGVRGELTAHVLSLAGVESRVTGCPSLFLNRSKKLGVAIARSLRNLAEGCSEAPSWQPYVASRRPKVAVTAAATFEVFNSQNPQLVEIERRLLRLAIESGGLYVQQSGGSEVIDISRGRFALASESATTSVARILGWASRESEFNTVFPRASRVFFDVLPWLNAVAKHDLSIGTRLHGNMLGIAAGIPAVFIPHDSRTQELIETMKVPWISQDAVSELSTLREILLAVNFDAGEFDRRRAELAANLEECLSHHSGASRKKLSHRLIRA